MFFAPLLQGAAQQQAAWTSSPWLRNVATTSIVGGLNAQKPAGTQATDVLIAVLNGDWNVGNVITAPAGWTQAPFGSFSTPRLLVYWALGSVASTQFFSSQSGYDGVCNMFAYAGANTSSPIRAIAGSETDTSTVTAPSVSAQAGDALVYAWADVQVTPSIGVTITPGGVAQRTSVQSATGNGQSHIVTATGAAVSTGATTAQSRNATGAFTTKLAVTVALAAGTPPPGYRSISSAVGSGVQSITGSLPSGAQPTDLLVAVLARVLPQIPIVPPAGWTRQTIPGLVDERLVIYTASGAATDFTWVWNANNDVVLQIAAFSGRSRNISGLALLQEDANTSFIAPSVTATANDSLMVVMWEWQRTNQLPDPAPSISVKSSLSALNGPASLIAVADNLSAGPTGNYTTTGTAFFDKYGIQLLLPAASTTPAFYIPPKRWSRQPTGPVRIDRTNPLTRGLVSVITPTFDHYQGRAPIKENTVVYTSTRSGYAVRGGGFSLVYSPVAGLGTDITIMYVGSVERTATVNITSALGATVGSQLFGFQFDTSRNNSAIIRQTDGGLVTARSFSTNATTASADKVVLHAVTKGSSDISVYWNGALDNGALATGSTGSNSVFDTNALNGVKRSGNVYSTANNNGAAAMVWNRALSAGEIAALARNPWQIFQPTQALVGAAVSAPSITITRPNSDIVVAGWTGVPNNASLYANIDEATASDTDYIISPDLSGSPGPAVFGLTQTLAAGTYSISFGARRTGTGGQIRALLLDSANTTVGTSSWQGLTNSTDTYTLTVTATGTADRVRLEVQP